MSPAYPQWPGFLPPFPNRGRRPEPGPALPVAPEEQPVEVPDRQSQLEDLLGHVRRCERMARLDDRIDRSWSLDGSR